MWWSMKGRLHNGYLRGRGRLVEVVFSIGLILEDKATRQRVPVY